MLPSQDHIVQTTRLIGLVPLVRMFSQRQIVSPIDLAHTETGGLRVASRVVVDSRQV